jgi:hypothetical protein
MPRRVSRTAAAPGLLGDSLSENEGNEGLRLCLVRRVLRREMRCHEPLLGPELHPEAGDRDRDEDDALDTSEEDHCADDHEEDCGIDRMAHEGVRARADQFVTFLERDAGTPIAAERNARPERENETEDAEDVAVDAPQGRGRQRGQREHGSSAREEEENADRQCDSDEDRGRGCRALEGRLHEERADDPEEEEDRPAAGYDPVGESHFSSIRQSP